MQINLSELFSSDGKEKTYTQDIEMPSFRHQMVCMRLRSGNRFVSPSGIRATESWR